MINKNLISLLKNTFQLDWNGIHGVSHWSRVRINGLKIAQNNHANQRVIELFSFLHDVQRENDYHDPKHGLRSSQFIQTLSNDLLKITDSEKELLCIACENHSNHKSNFKADITIQTCFDADALDLGRVGIKPHPERLYTDIAKDKHFIQQAYKRSIYSNKITTHNILNKLW